MIIVSLVPACKDYATATNRWLSYDAVTSAGRVMASTLEQRLAAQPLVQLASYLDVAAAAAAVLKGNSSDTQVLKDSDFGLSRAVEVVKNSGMEPWKTLRQTGSWAHVEPGGNLVFSQTGPEHHAAQPMPFGYPSPRVYEIHPLLQIFLSGSVSHLARHGFGGGVSRGID